MDKSKKRKNIRTSVFIEAAIHDHFENRPVEEKHLDFNSWVQLQILRVEKSEEIESKKAHLKWVKEYECEQRNKIELNRNKTNKNKEYYKDIIIPDNIKKMSTRELLSMRYSYWHNEDNNHIYAELANRPHIPNKAENKKLRREAAKRKK